MKKRSVKIQGHATSVSLEPEFWDVLQNIAAQRKMSTTALIEAIEASKTIPNLSSAIRVFVLKSLLGVIPSAAEGSPLKS